MSSVVLIDDDDLLRESIKSLLVSNGHEVKEADNGFHGLELIKSTAPDVIITDIVMPEMDGLTLMNKINQLNTSAKVIALSGEIRDDNTLFNKVVERLADVVLSKPATTNDILKNIN